jgi:hypothetical protein
MEKEHLEEYRPMVDRSKILEKYEGSQLEQQDVKEMIHEVQSELQSRKHSIKKDNLNKEL